MANAATAFLDDPIAAGCADRVAIVTPSGRATYADLLARVNRTGNALKSIGVEPEQRVAVLLDDGIDWATTFFGALRIGAVAVPLNTRLGEDDWAAMLRDSRAKVLVAEAAMCTKLLSHFDDLPHLKVAVASSSLDAVRRDARPDLQPEPVSDDDMAFWLYTSGTTGGPKAAVHAHRDLRACHHYGIGVLGVTGDDRVYATSKLFFAYALGNALAIPLYAGAQTYLDPAWPDPAQVARVMAAFRPTLFFSVPTFFARLLGADVSRETFSSVRCAVSAGERLPEGVYHAWRERFDVEIVEGLGATETIFMALSNVPGKSLAGSAGRAVPGTDARLVDAEGRDVTDGEPGVLHVKTPSTSARYWNRQDQSRRAFVGEWFRTGDVCVRDADGAYRHVGREDDLFKVAGQWVSPTDVENALRSHPAVADVGVVGSEDATGLIKAFAFVVPRDVNAGREGLVKDLEQWAETKLAPHQRPRVVSLVDSLPRTATGKLQRYLLRGPGV